jgi:hypothetical protein
MTRTTQRAIRLTPLTMTKTEQKALRLTPVTVEQAQDLAKLWGPVKALSLADVVAECIKRVHEAESRKNAKTK